MIIFINTLILTQFWFMYSINKKDQDIGIIILKDTVMLKFNWRVLVLGINNLLYLILDTKNLNIPKKSIIY